MEKYKVLKINCEPEDAEQLLAVGIVEGAIIEVVEKNYQKICMVTIDGATFCIRGSVYKLLELEEIV